MSEQCVLYVLYVAVFCTAPVYLQLYMVCLSINVCGSVSQCCCSVSKSVVNQTLLQTHHLYQELNKQGRQ